MKRLAVILCILAVSGCAHRSAWEIARDIEYVRDTPGCDHWQSPQETLARGAGDCEDGAILLWWLLREAGHDDVRVVFGKLYILLPWSAHAWVEMGEGMNAIVMDPTMQVMIPRYMLDVPAYYELRHVAVWRARAWWFTARTGIKGYNRHYEKPLIAP